MSTTINTLSSKIDLPPGTLLHLGKKRMDQTKISILSFSATDFVEHKNCEVEKIDDAIKSDMISWINIDGIHEIEVIEEIGKVTDLHPLLMEDILNTYLRPKFEDHESHIYVNSKMIGLGTNEDTIATEQVGFVLGSNYLISFQEQEGDIFDSIRTRIRENKGQVRNKSIDYFLYRLIDTVVDNYFLVTEHFTNMSEELERRVLEEVNQDLLIEIQQLKKTLIRFRRMIVPLREAISSLYKEENKLVKDDTKPFIRDVYENIIQLMEWGESQREMVNGIMDLYHTEVSNRMNKVMQVLTIIATIFIPITFIAGIYGMNFEVIPELKWKYGYLFFWILILALVAIMISYFKRKKWF